jgi:hypothetical protein
VKRWHAVLSALLVFLPRGAIAADDPGGAARELARKTAAFAGRGALVVVTWRTISPAEPGATGPVRVAFEAALQDAGLRIGENAPSAEIHITLSANATQYLMVEEINKGEERQVWIAAWKRSESPAASVPGATLEKKLVWEQDEQILDMAFPAGGLMVLSPSKIALYARSNSQWVLRQTVPVTWAKARPRDLRGHLRVNGKSFQAFLPGMACSGVIEPALSLDCRASDEPWVLESGSRAMLLANFAPTRNYFDGRVVTQTGLRKTVAPFFSAASMEDQGRTWWVLAMADGRTQVFDAALEPAGGLPAWGSDIAGTDAPCGAGSQVLATRPGDRDQPDGIQAFALVNHTAIPLTDMADFPGPVVALWTSGGNSVLAVVQDLRTGKYEAYVVTVACGR